MFEIMFLAPKWHITIMNKKWALLFSCSSIANIVDMNWGKLGSNLQQSDAQWVGLDTESRAASWDNRVFFTENATSFIWANTILRSTRTTKTNLQVACLKS